MRVELLGLPCYFSRSDRDTNCQSRLVYFWLFTHTFLVTKQEQLGHRCIFYYFKTIKSPVERKRGKRCAHSLHYYTGLNNCNVCEVQSIVWIFFFSSFSLALLHCGVTLYCSYRLYVIESDGGGEEET